MSAGGPTVEPGWYPVEDGTGELCWWDGSQWTDHRQKAEPSVPAPQASLPAVNLPTPQAPLPVVEIPPVVASVVPHVAAPVPAAGPLFDNGQAGTNLLSMSPLSQIAAGVLGFWAFFAFFLSWFGFFAEGGSFSPKYFFAGPHDGTAGLFGGYDEWWYDSPLGNSTANIFLLVPIAVLGLAIATIVTRNTDFLRIASLLALGLLAFGFLADVPLRHEVWEWRQFIPRLFQMWLLPGLAGFAILQPRQAETLLISQGIVLPDILGSMSVGGSTSVGAVTGGMVSPLSGTGTAVGMPAPIAAAPIVPSPMSPSGAPGSMAQVQRTNGFAIAALVLGIIGGSILAIVFGHVARSQIRTSGEKGAGMATAGLVLGYIWLALTIVYMIFLVSVLNSLNSY